MSLKSRLREAMAGPPKISQAALARACKISPVSVNDWLSGKTQRLTGTNLLTTARVLGVNPEWLDTGRGPMRPANSGEGTLSEPPKAGGLASQFERLDPAILVEAERWALIFQAAGGEKYSDLQRMEQVAEVYGQIVADGGVLSDQNHQAYLRQLEQLVNRRGDNGQSDEKGRGAAQRRVGKR